MCGLDFSRFSQLVFILTKRYRMQGFSSLGSSLGGRGPLPLKVFLFMVPSSWVGLCRMLVTKQQLCEGESSMVAR